MQGLELSRNFYLEFGQKMLKCDFGDVSDRIAVGLAGEGSECFGYDDDISRDHDFDAGFCLWITKEDEQNFGFRLERAYSKLPKEFCGVRRQMLSPVGGNRRGVIIIEDFYTKFLGAPTPPDTPQWWLSTPSYSLACACNGEVFCDPLGKFSEVRNVLLSGYPENIRRKKLAAYLLLMAQSGQYNYARCVTRGERGAAQLAMLEFVKNVISAIYLLNNKYEPFYKWVYRGMRELPTLGDMAELLTSLTELDNTKGNAELKQEIIEDIASLFITELQAQELTQAICGDLERHAYSVLDSVKDSALRNMHILDGI